MFRYCRELWLPVVLVGASVVFASPARANVDLELSLSTPGSVVNGSPVYVEVYAVSDSAEDQAVGQIDLVFTWDNAALELTGYADPLALWSMSSFPDDSAGDGLNYPYGPVPANDGDALYRAISTAGVLAPPSPGLLVTTLEFVAIDTAASADVTIEVNIGSTYTTVLDSWMGGDDVTGVFLGNPVTVTIYCDIDDDCDDGNDCTDDVCNDPGANGWCSHDPLGEGVYCGDGPGVCSDQDTCDDAGTCLPNDHPSDTWCGDGPGVCSDQDTCDGAGTCLPNHHDSGTWCGDPDDTDCTDPDTCDGNGTCLPNHADNGTPCDDGLYCTVDEYCTDGECGNGGFTCDDGFDCTDDSCDEVLDQCTNAPNDAYCADDGLYCTGDEICDPQASGADPVTGCVSTGDPCVVLELLCREATDECVECLVTEDCDDEDECSWDFCEASGTCLYGPMPEGTVCTQNEFFCDGEEICNGETPWACISPGDPCDDENCCTDDECYETDPPGTGYCVNTCDDGNYCDDGEYCNGVDYCYECELVVPGDQDCSDWEDDCNEGLCDEVNDWCYSSPTNEGGDCEDGDACTFGDTCSMGDCIAGERPTGSGNVEFRWIPDSWEVLTGETIHISLWVILHENPPEPNPPYYLFANNVVLSWDPEVLELLGIDDSNDEYDWFFSWFVPDEFQDGLNHDCFHDGYCPPPSDCDYDYDCPCDEWQTCQNHQCLPTCNIETGFCCPYSWLPYNDGDALYEATSRFCDPPCFAELTTEDPDLLMTTFMFETLQEAPSGTQLTIVDCVGDFPTITMVNRGGANGQLQGELGSATIMIYECVNNEDCDDGVDCTIDTCNASHLCEHEPNNAACDNGQYCDGVEICDPDDPGADPVTGCVVQAGSVPDCDDQISCTDDTCDEVNDECVNDPNDANCDDWDYCTGVEICDPLDPGADPVTGCLTVPGSVPDCDDGFDCTYDWCSTSQGACVYTPNDGLCVDDLFCNGEETCDPENPGADPITGCVAGVDPCYPLWCDEENDTCGSCDAPLVAAVGGRYLAITPQQASEGMSFAFLVTYCDGAVSKYVGNVVDNWPLTTEPGAPVATLGFLVDDPLDAEHRTLTEWGETVYVTGEDMIPSVSCKWDGEQPPDPANCRLYEVQAECPGPVLSDPVEATYIDVYENVIPGTYDWGDIVSSNTRRPDHVVGLADILVQVNAFQGNWQFGDPPGPIIIPNLDIGQASGAADLCEPDQVIGLSDIMLTIGAFQGTPFNCPDPCSP